MPGAEDALRRLVSAGVPVGLLSNAQSNTLSSLGGISELLEERLVVLSYQHRIAKPSRRLFEIVVERLETLGIRPGEVLFIGNDPMYDIAPAAAHGFVTALFTGETDQETPAPADFVLRRWSDLWSIVSAKMHIE
jgi:putative hydrolase of the HAD superfamily